jgi:uncharacterized protein (TIGR02300 family)
VSKSDLGTKRVCPTTGRRFYDLNKDPVISPYTGQVVPIAPLPRSSRPETASPRKTEQEEAVEAPEAEFVSLEEAEAESTGGGKVAAVPDTDDEDVEIETTEDDTFLETDEDEDADVSDIIDADIDDEEET